MSRNFRFVRSYVGQVKAAILDWSGTTADKYVLAPAVVFVDVFEKHKVTAHAQRLLFSGQQKKPKLKGNQRKDLQGVQKSKIVKAQKKWTYT